MGAAISLAFWLTTSAIAGRWTDYANGRYAYLIDVPPGFSAVAESDNGDGGTSISADGRASLNVWGSYLTEGSFSKEIAWRIQQDKADGWDVSYERQTAKWASWSGGKGPRLFYARAVAACDGAAAYFQLEYEKSDIKIYDAIVKRLVKSLRSDGC
jgi:hypothetical protein